MHNLTVKKAFAWCGPISLLFFFSGMITSGFFPPISPALSQAEVVSLYQENHTNILIGMTLVMMCGMWVFPFVGLMTEQMLRIKGASPALAYTQLSAGTFGVIGFSVPGILFLATAYRIDQDPAVLHMMHDLSWIMTVLPWPFQFVVNIVIGIAVLSDKSNTPVFPRWFGFFSLWMAVFLPPATLLVFFDNGPFAWNGLFPYWIPAVVFGLYFGTLCYLLIQAINMEASDQLAESLP